MNFIVDVLALLTPLAVVMVGAYWWDKDFPGLGKFIVFILTPLVTFGLIVGGIKNTTPTPFENKPLISLQDGQSIHGSFFLGSGSIEGKMVYTWYEKNKNNQYELNTQDASEAVIIYTKGNPHVSIPDKYSAYKHWYLPSFGSDEKVRFYVPRGSIKNDYTLDAK